MVARALWSPSRIRTALQCGRRLQASIERWERKEHIRGIRGRAVHAAVEAWESSEREAEPITATAEAWWDILDEAEVERPDEILKPVVALWESDRAIAAEEEAAYQDLADQYKNVRASKAYKERTAHLAADREAAAKTRSEVEALVDGVNWPWDSDQGVLVEGFDHSLETTRKGMEYLSELWPEPDIIGAEWNLEADLGNGYRVHGFIDRVEGSDGVEIVDYKSSKYQDSPLDHFIQVSTYAVIAEAHMGFAPARVRLVYLRGQQSDVFEVRPEWREQLCRFVEAADRVLAEKDFTPTFTGCGICSWFYICSAEFQLVEIRGAA